MTGAHRNAKRRANFDPIAVVEAAYRFDAHPRDWLDELSLRARPFFPERAHMLSLIINTQAGARPEHMFSENAAEDNTFVPAYLEALDKMPPAVQRLINGTPRLTSMSEVLGRPPRSFPEIASHTPGSLFDYLGIAARDPSGYTVQIGVSLPEVTQVDPQAAALWDRLSAHITTGFRLNRTMRDLGLDEAHAIITPNGKMEHAASKRETQPRIVEALRTAAVNLESARKELRRSHDPIRILDLWKGLVRGTYSLVDYFDNDDRRYYIARRNDPHLEHPRSLNQRERQIAAYVSFGYDNARIAYELGLSPSTISYYVRRIVTKLGLRSRVDLIRLAAQDE